MRPLYYDRDDALPEALTIRVWHQPGHMLVTVSGEVDIGTAGQPRSELAALATDGSPLVVDLEQVTFIDASGLGAIAGAAKRAAAHDISLHVVAARPQTRRLFAITGLDRHIPVMRTLAEALAALTYGLAADARATGDPPVPGQKGRRAPAMPIRFIPPARLPAASEQNPRG